MKYIKYDKKTGEILAQNNAPKEYLSLEETETIGTLRGEGDDVLDIVNLKTMKIIKKRKSKMKVDKKTILANGSEVATISKIPKGSRVTILGAGAYVETTIDDGTLEITVDVAGEYLITINSFPYLEYKGVIYGKN